MQKVKIYCLVDPRTERPFYVGATSRELKYRLNEHIKEELDRGIRGKKAELIKQILTAGYLPQIKLIKEVKYDDVDKCEAFYIKKFIRNGFELFQIHDRCTYKRTINEKSLAKRNRDYYLNLDKRYKEDVIKRSVLSNHTK